MEENQQIMGFQKYGFGILQWVWDWKYGGEWSAKMCNKSSINLLINVYFVIRKNANKLEITVCIIVKCDKYKKFWNAEITFAFDCLIGKALFIMMIDIQR